MGRFDGGEITSDAGDVLLRGSGTADPDSGSAQGVLPDHRDPDRIEHCVEALIKQRMLGLSAWGYQDLNDHDELCQGRLLALLRDRGDLTGKFPAPGVGSRQAAGGQEHPVPAGVDSPVRVRSPSTQKIVADPARMDELPVEVLLEEEGKRRGMSSFSRAKRSTLR